MHDRTEIMYGIELKSDISLSGITRIYYRILGRMVTTECTDQNFIYSTGFTVLGKYCIEDDDLFHFSGHSFSEID
jgi:hypothetical protein